MNKKYMDIGIAIGIIRKKKLGSTSIVATAMAAVIHINVAKQVRFLSFFHEYGLFPLDAERIEKMLVRRIIPHMAYVNMDKINTRIIFLRTLT